MDTEHVFKLITDSEDWLMERILHYAKRSKYTMYTSTLKEAWRMSIVGLSSALMASLSRGGPPELTPDDKLQDDPMVNFGVKEAERHRARGISPVMFLGLFKYYRQAYRDLSGQAQLDEEIRAWLEDSIERFFDRVEVAFLQQWTGISEERKNVELQGKNRELTNEKNKYLTIFESIAEPVALLDRNGRVENMNLAAMALINASSAPGTLYYGEPWDEGKSIISPGQGQEGIKGRLPEELFPCLGAGFTAECGKDASGFSKEASLLTPSGERHFTVRTTPMQDISGKFTGTVLSFQDVTDHLHVEQMLKTSHKSLENNVAQRTMELQSKNLALAEEALERKEAEAALRLVVEGTSFTEGEDFFHSLVRHLANAFGVSVALAAELQDPAKKWCRTLSIWKESGYDDNFDFPFDEMPCESVYHSKQIVYYPDDVQSCFPKNEYISRLNARGYISVPMINSDGSVIGHISLIDKKPVVRGKYFNSVLLTLAMRAASELERKRGTIERENLQRRLSHAEKLSFIGTFISSVAHDLNNPLGIVLGFSQRLLRKGSLQGETVSDMEIIAAESKRAVEIVKNLLEISRRQKPVKTPIDVNQVLEKAAGSRQEQNRGPDVSIRLDLAAGLPPAMGNASQLHQVFTNILANAVQAIRRQGGQNGLIVCSSRRIGKSELGITLHNNGPSIPEQIISRIFDPFFTTSEAGEGTGLGLYVCHGVVEDMGGRIWVENPAEGGVSFHIIIPACREGLSLSGHDFGVRPIRKDLKALVIDDEVNLLTWLRKTLEDVNIRVTTAVDAEAATGLLENDKFDLIISDIKMPRMDGFSFVRWLYQNRPDQLGKLIITTGVIDDVIMDYCRLYGCQYLMKPFAEQSLMELIYRISGGETPRTLNPA